MTVPRREWIRTFAADPAALSALSAAAKTCMREGCEDHEPADCTCQVQMMTPLEFAEWVENEMRRAGRAPIRLDHRENRKAGQETRYSVEMAVPA